MKQLTLDNIEHSGSIITRTPRVHFNLSTTTHSRNATTQPHLLNSKDTFPQSTNDSSLYQGKTISKTPKYTSIKLFNNNNMHLTERSNKHEEFFNENGKVNHFKGHGTSLLKAYQDKGNTKRSKFIKSKTMLHSSHNYHYDDQHKRTHNMLHTLEYDTLPIMLLPKKPSIPDTKGLLTKREELLLKNIDKHLLPDKDHQFHLKQELIDHCAIRNKQPCNIQGCLQSLSKVLDLKQRSRRKSCSLQPRYLNNHNNNNTATISTTIVDDNSGNNTIEENDYKALLTFNEGSEGMLKRFRKTKTLAFTSLKSRDALLKRSIDWLDDSYKVYKECVKKGTKKANKIAGTIMDIIGEYEEQMDDQNGFSINNLNRVIILKQIQKGHFDEGTFDSINTRRGTNRTREKTIAALSKLGPPHFLKNNFKASTIIKFKQNTGIFMGSKEKEKI